MTLLPAGLNPLGAVAAAALILNLPFGYWRAGTGRFSLQWFLAVHLPVPVIVVLRVLSGIGWQLATLPVLVAAYCAGQFLGGRFRRWRG